MFNETDNGQTRYCPICEELRKYKQVTSLRSVNGMAVYEFLNSDSFKAFIEEMDSGIDEPELISI